MFIPLPFPDKQRVLLSSALTEGALSSALTEGALSSALIGRCLKPTQVSG
jgi:hypothetical protein